MILIKHRVNKIVDLKKLPIDYGAEVDIRSDNNNLIIHHDPFKKGVLFKRWLKHFRHNTLIINQKEEGLEPKILELLRDSHIDNYFFLDQSIPFLIKHSKLLDKNSAARLSEYESINTVISLQKHIKWVWLDCFSSISFNPKDIQLLKNKGIKLCLVSPELQGRELEPEIRRLLKNTENPFGKNFETLDAVCTKNIELWKSFLE